jgi:2-oxoisovalerate dehydrogenase E2 component (dihydrolipoyl transacylase)
MSTFNLPDLGEGLQEAEIVSWHVAEGDHVVVDQPLVSVETEKAVVEIPSPKAGHIARLLGKVGARMKVGAPLLAFEEGPHAETGTVVGELARPASATAGLGKAAAPAPPSAIRASPAVRARARELAVDLSVVPPSGADGVLTRADVEAAAAAQRSPAGDEELRGARRTMAVNMARAWREVAHATIQDEADIAAWAPTEDVTCRLVRAIITACRAEPCLNASFDAASFSLRENARIDLGLAIDGPDGLFVPVLRDVAESDPQQWRQRIDAVKNGVAQRSLAPEEFRGATITLSNFGTIAGRHAALIVMPPQVAIVGAGRITERPIRSTDGAEFHRTLPLSLTFDHRAVTGGQAARFLGAVMIDLELAE